MAIDGRSYSTVKVGNGTNVKIEYRDFAESTASIVKEYAQQGYPDKYVIFTEHQATSVLTGTKLKEGTLDKGIFMSLLLRPSFLPAQAAVLGPMSVVALIKALESYTTKDLGISWVSDVFCEGIKIGGTQIEGKLKDTTSYDYIIITFSARLDKKNFPKRLKESVKRVFTQDNSSNGMMIAKTVLDKFFKAYTNINAVDDQIKYYKNKFILKNVRVKYLDQNKRRTGTVIGLDEITLSLIIKSPGGNEITIYKHSGVIIPSRIKLSKKTKDKE